MKIIRCNSGNIMMVLKEVEDVSNKEISCNSVDASFEKHVPQYEFTDDGVLISVNHVMDDDHYIEWISVVYNNKEVINYLNPSEEALLHCKYISGSKIYAYCNKHGLWEKDVE